MRTLAALFLLAMGLPSTAQIITFEHAYDTASVPGAIGLGSQLFMVDFEYSGQKYVRVNKRDKTINIYNLNHTLYKSMVIPGTMPPPTLYNYTIMYLSEHLFDNDNEIEFLIAASFNTPPSSMIDFETAVYNEDSTQLFYAEDEFPAVVSQWHAQQYPIYNTAVGTKLILSRPVSGEAKVYSLLGTLTVNIQLNTESMIENNNVFAYPNPTTNQVTINYNLKDNFTTAQMHVYDVNGALVKTVELTQQTAEIMLDIKGLSSGTYYYSITADGQTFTGDKLIIIN
ncbi:MAG: T9SS type A sorting domain-containing protein [Flavobacteriales bacterium]